MPERDRETLRILTQDAILYEKKAAQFHSEGDVHAARRSERVAIAAKNTIIDIGFTPQDYDDMYNELRGGR